MMGDRKRCKKCLKNLNSRSEEPRIICAICKDHYHIQCSEIDEEMFKLLSVSQHVIYTCTTCMNAIDKNKDINDIMCIFEQKMSVMMHNFTEQIKNVFKEIDAMKSKINDMSKNTPMNVKSNLQKRKWSDIVNDDEQITPTLKLRKTNDNRNVISKNSDVIDKQSYIIVVKPADTNDITESHKDMMKKIVTTTVNPINDPVLSFRFTSKGKMIIKCKDNESVKNMKEKLNDKLGDTYVVDEPQKSKPTLRINNIDELDYLNDEELLNSIRKQNREIISDESKIEIIKVQGHEVMNRKNECKKWYSAIIQLDKSTFDLIVRKKAIKIGWSYCRVNVNHNITRCYKCNGYNHKAVECQESNHMCPKCAGPHKVHECKSGEIKCCNCARLNTRTGLNVPINHYSWSERCSVYQRKCEKLSSRVRYEK